MEVKDSRTLRVALAWHDIPVTQFAREAGMSMTGFNDLLRGNRLLNSRERARIQPALDRVEAGEIVRDLAPRGRSVAMKRRAEQLREEQLASGCTATIRYT